MNQDTRNGLFLDKATIQVASGKGGNGLVAWRREKFVPNGGPAGGDGGRGGDVYLEATEDLNTLLDFRFQSKFKAEDGEKGRNKNCHGKGADDLTIRVPCGTIVRDSATGNAIADMREPGQRVLVASGGRGGRGNARFLSNTRRAPQFSEPGEAGIERTLILELKLIADVGIIGLPNAGKSTLISVISAAKPKIADYPFTTLAPNLGVVRRPSGDGIVVADIPGLIEGASKGAGLGHEFLRHVERTRLLIHLVDASDPADPVANWRIINQELAQYRPELAQKPQIVVLSKIDAVDPERLEALRQELTQQVPTVLLLSSVTRRGVDELVHAMLAVLDTIPLVESVVDLHPDEAATNHDDSAFEVFREGRAFHVMGGRIRRLVEVTDFRNRAATYRLMNILNAMGVNKALEAAGAHPGDTVIIAGHELSYEPEQPEEEEEEDGSSFPIDLPG